MAYKKNKNFRKGSKSFNNRKSKYTMLEQTAFKMGVEASIVESIAKSKDTRVYDSYKAGLNASKSNSNAKKPLM